MTDLWCFLNTVGGDVEAGLAIAEMIAGMSKPTVSLVLGGGHSIGVPLAVATDYSFIAPTATMTVHPLRMNGVVIGVMQTFQYFQNMQDRIIDFVVSNSNISYDKFKQLMLTTDEIANDVGSILFAKKAVEYGLINEMGGLKDALEKMYELIEKERENKNDLFNSADRCCVFDNTQIRQRHLKMYNNVTLELTDGRVERIISTNPQDYLKYHNLLGSNNI